MIIALALRQILTTSQGASPLSPSDNLVPASSCNDRSVADIVKSCLTTIFTCTWIAIHPNIPRPGERAITRRFKIFAIALIAPEFIILWAFRQWFSARHLSYRFKEYGWTHTHGFFATMGGFRVCNPDDSTSHILLRPEDIEPYLKNRIITITEEEILDKSKGDILSKALVLLQVSWFIIQVLARAIQHLAITEIEIVTLGFAILSFVTYFCWWNKPLDVDCPIRINESDLGISTKPTEHDVGQLTLDFEPVEDARDSIDADNDPHRALMPLSSTPDDSSHPVEYNHRVQPLSLADAAPSLAKQETLAVNNPSMEMKDLNEATDKVVPGTTMRHKIQSLSEKFVRYIHQALSIAIKLHDQQVAKNTSFSRNLTHRGVEEENPYSSGIVIKAAARTAALLSYAIAVVFGATHVLGWNLDFPTKTEQWLWRASSIVITCTPIFVVFTISDVAREWWSRVSIPRGLGLLKSLLLCFVGTCISLYPVARMLLLVEMFVVLRDPNPGIFTPVEWVTYLPHI